MGKLMLLRLFRLPAAAAVLVLLAPAAASADQYVVTSCTDPLGQPNAALGWNPSSGPGGFTANSCATSNGVLKAWLPDANPPGTATASWRFDAPSGTRIVRLTGTRTTVGLAGGTAEQNDISYVLAGSGGQTLEVCAPAAANSSCTADLTGPVDKQGLNATFVEFRVLCTNVGRTCTRPVGVQATQIWPTLEDPTAPVVSNPQMIDDGDVSGTLRVRYDATDVGGGLYRTIVKVDGTIAQVAPLGAAPCADVNPNDADPFQFSVPVPCPPGVTGAEAVVQASKLAAGPHGVEIAVQDAAGNETPVFGPVLFPKTNAGIGGSSTPAQLANIRNATLKMWFVKARNHGRRYTTRYGMRVVTRGVLRGRDGRGIQGARVDVYHIRKGKRRILKTGLKSRARGQLTLILPLDVDTRTIEFAYRALRPGPITSRQRLHLTVLRKGKIYHRR
jgi:hypothetical protein